ncbi:MAG: hypothetical protein JWN73_1729, partial [Betaproteobacteria bacterium]|nr:hypothetical protein [Betaproteobacteria bacterium]
IGSGGTTINLSATGGTISQSAGNIVSSGTTTANATGAINLTSGTNDFGTVTASGAAITLVDANDMILSGVTGTGLVNASGVNLTLVNVTGNGLGVIGSGAVGIGGNVSTTGGAINLTGLNVSQGTGTLSAGAAALNLKATGGAITQSGGNITSSGTTTANATGAVNLTSASNDFGTVTATAGTGVSLTDTNTIKLTGITTTSGGVTVTATGTTLAGDINTTGGAVNLGGAGAVTLGANVQIATGHGTTGGSVDFGINAIDADIAGTRTLTVDATGSSSSGTVTVGSIGSTAALGGLTLKGSSLNLRGGTIKSAGTTTFVGAAANTSAVALTMAVDDLDLTAGTLNVNGQNLVLTTQNHTNNITLGGGGGLSLTQAELGNISNVAGLTIGDAAQTGAINIASAINITSTGATTVNLINGGSSIDFSGGLTMLGGSMLNVTANAGGGAVGAITDISGGSILGPSTINLTAASGIGAGGTPGAPIKVANTGVTTVSALNTGSGGIFIQTQGTLNSGGIANSAAAVPGTSDVNLSAVAGGITFNTAGIQAGNSNIVLSASGPITQVNNSAIDNGLVTGSGSLTVNTFNDASTSNIDLSNGTSGATNGNNVGGGVRLETHQATSPALLSGASIAYSSVGGTKLNGLGTTGVVTLNGASFDFVSNQPLIGGTVTVNATGSITITADIPNGTINQGQAGGSLTLNAGTDIIINGQIGGSTAQPTQNVVSTDAFNHPLTLNATGNINVNKSIYLTTDLSFKAGGSVNISNAAGTKALVIKAANILFGDAAHRVAGVNIIGGTATAGLDRSVLVQAAGSMNVYSTGDFSITGGSATGTGAIAAAAIGGNSVMFNILNGSLNVSGGSGLTGGNAKALVQGTSAKSIVVGNNLFIKGGTSSGSGDATAIFDPSGTLVISAGHNVIVEAGTGPGSNASLANEGALDITVNLSGISAYRGTAGLIVVGDSLSGLYNTDINGKTPYTLGNGSPQPIVLHNGIFTFVADATLGGSGVVIANVPQSGNPDLAQQILSTNVGTQVGLDGKNKKVQDEGCN